jgi:hypothetical protein
VARRANSTQHTFGDVGMNRNVGFHEMRNYCTLFDRNYLFQGMALYRSLVRHTSNFRLFALCMDETAHDLVKAMESITLVPIGISELLNPEIERVRGHTTHGQFCWVCQPLICEYILDRFDAGMVTYLEADSLFFSDPEVLFDELGEDSVSLVPHNFSAEFDNSAEAGLFCVQFNTFRNDEVGRRVLAYWKKSCFKYDKATPNEYPGQTSLDDWPRRFGNVRVLRNLGAGVAPWNVRGYLLEMVDAVPHVNGMPVVFFHFHQYGRYKSGAHELGGYPLAKNVVEYFYAPYISELRQAEASVRAVDAAFEYRREYAELPTFRVLLTSLSAGALISYLNVIKRKLRQRFNVYPDQFFP